MTKFKVTKSMNCDKCRTQIYLVHNTESDKKFWMETKPEDIPPGDDWKPHFHNPAWCKGALGKSPQQQTSQDEDYEEQEKVVKATPKPTKTPVIKKRETMKPDTPDMETADQTLLYDRSYKLVELTISKTRKVSQATIPQMPQYENFTIFVAAKLECELGADFQRIARDTFAKVELALDKKLEQERIKYIPEDE